MKIFYAILGLALLNITAAKAQDLIVTRKGDSIQCKIVNVTAAGILFWQRQDNDLKKSRIPPGEVKIYEINFYAKSTKGNVIGKGVKYDKFTISPYGGLSYLIAKTSDQVPSNLRDYIKELKSGYHLGADATFFVSRTVGIGIKYVSFRTSNEGKVSTTQSGQTFSGPISDNITTYFIAPVLATRSTSINERTILNFGFSAGYLSYKNDATLIQNFKLTGNTVGVGLDLGIEQKLNKTVGLELKVGAIGGSLGEVEKTTGGRVQTIKLAGERRESLSRIDLSLGLKWHF